MRQELERAWMQIRKTLMPVVNREPKGLVQVIRSLSTSALIWKCFNVDLGLLQRVPNLSYPGDMEGLKLSSSSGTERRGRFQWILKRESVWASTLSCLTIGEDQINSIYKRIREELCARKQTVLEYPGLILT